MTEERLWELLSLQLSGEATANELEELEKLMQKFPGAAMQAEITGNIWRSRQEETTNKGAAFDRHLQRLSNHLSVPVLQFDEDGRSGNEPNMRFFSKHKWLLISGVAASVLIAFLLLVKSGNKKAIAGRQLANTVSTKPASKSRVELPDGTQVWLNADSKITYDQNFMGNFREVQLSGEAYFEVTHDKTRPFIIHTHAMDVKVLGTVFNVRSYPDERTAETSLIQGSVEITLRSSPDKKIILRPNEKLIVNNTLASIQNSDSVHAYSTVEEEPVMTLSKVRYAKQDTGSIETMWVKNKLAFENETFERMSAELEHWYNVTVELKNEKLKSLHFTGVFENKPLNEVMEALCYSRHLQYEVKEGKVVIW